MIRWNEHFYAAISMAYTENPGIIALSPIPIRVKPGSTAGVRAEVTIGMD
ncbi:hypothetical protein GCM10009304_14310 [Pseudomonas matsuisoli]|uniref:Uncharacterized protein n=1 Tax=Pseudomonas matsuisoli TaxID=1515666 RepID=A0A917UW86_9PSED|nr:hypothetical protein GCM10009304_14310 [Pseudomonas matsuisoli]